MEAEVQRRPSGLRPLPTAGAKQVRKRFMGIDDDATKLVISPIKRFFLHAAPGPETSIWPSFVLHGLPSVLVPQGRAVVDAICCLPPDTQVLFLGLAGGLTTQANIGDWWAIERAANRTGCWDASLTLAAKPEAVPGVTVDSLTESWLQTETLREQGTVVDMETAHVYEAAKACCVRALSLVMISDAPPLQPFWATKLDELPDPSPALAKLLSGWRSDG